MLSLSPEWKAQGGKVPEGSIPPRGSARPGTPAPALARDQRGPKQCRASGGPGKPGPHGEPLRGAGCRLSPVQPPGPGKAELRATSPPARPPGTRSHLAQKALRLECREMRAAASWNFADIAPQLRSSAPLSQEEAEAAAESRGIARPCLRLAGCRRLPPPGTQRLLLKAPAAG
ncbi:hypothetical protein HispidOSU_012784 [Sigmodon hispidus]